MPTQKKFRDSIHAKGTEIAVLSTGDANDYISLTDIARYKSDAPDDVIKNWMRNRDTIEFLGLWEQLNNPDFKPVEFDGFRVQAGSNAFTMSPKKWIEATGAIGIVSKAGRYGGTFAQKDIAFEFASWISAEFKLYIIKDYQRLKNDENSRLALGWNLNRTLAKINYRVHTDQRYADPARCDAAAAELYIRQRSRCAERCAVWNYGKRMAASAFGLQGQHPR